MSPVAYGKGAKGRATRLHSQVVRARGACERCGSTYRLECAHIIGRRFSATRTDERNAWCLCSPCHRRLTDHPDEHMAFVFETIGVTAFMELKNKALSNPRPWREHEWEAEAERLRAMLQDAE